MKDQPSKPAPHSRFLFPSALIMLGMVVLISAFEIIKHLTALDREGHFLTILFTSLAAILAVMIIATRFKRVQAQLVNEVEKHQKTEAELRQSQEKFRLLAETIQDAFYLAAPGIEKMIYVSPAYETIWGRSLESLYNSPKSFVDAIHPEDREHTLASLLEHHSLGTGWSLEYRITRPDGSIRWIQDRGFPVRDETGNLWLIAGAAVDITARKLSEEALKTARDELELKVTERTGALSLANVQLQHEVEERRRAEDALRESEARYRKLVEQVPAVMYLAPLSDYSSAAYVSPQIERVLGYSQADFQADPLIWKKQLHPEDRERVLAELNRCQDTGEPFILEYRLLDKSGQVKWFRDEGTLVHGKKGAPIFLQGLMVDVTEARRARETLKKSAEALQKSETNLRYFASRLLTAQERERWRISRELHDELGHALLVLKLRVSSLKDRLRKDQKTMADDCRQLLGYLDQVIDNVRRLSRDLSPGSLQEIGLSAALGRMVNEFKKHYQLENCELDLDDIGDLLPPDAKVNLYRILQESLTNIGKYARANRVRVSVKRRGEEVQVAVEDDGNGFDLSSVLATEASGRGLGLVAIEERVRMLGGALEISTQPGQGTKIHFAVPIPSGESPEPGGI